VFATCFAALWALIATVIFVLRAQLYRKNIQQSHDELVRLNALLKQQAETDFLTGCMNRRYFDKVLKQAVDQGHRQSSDLSLALFDIDYFKRINDTFGHDIGDRVLQHLSKLAQQHLQPSNSFARLGGEEFAILMPDTDILSAQAQMEALRAHIASTPLIYGELLPIPMTISIGVTALAASDNGSSLLQRADSGMYQAKEAGRNRVIAC
jgi:diguanylate cyclase (GGDEF)-like protein